MPRHTMPHDAGRMATVAELYNALSAARCSAQLAGIATDDFMVRELLLAVIEQLDRAAEYARRLHGSV